MLLCQTLGLEVHDFGTFAFCYAKKQCAHICSVLPSPIRLIKLVLIVLDLKSLPSLPHLSSFSLGNWNTSSIQSIMSLIYFPIMSHPFNDIPQTLGIPNHIPKAGKPNLLSFFIQITQYLKWFKIVNHQKAESSRALSLSKWNNKW